MKPQPSRSPQVSTPGSADAYLSPEEVSDLIGIPLRTLSTWRSQRKGPLFYRLGVHVRYPKSHLDRWLEKLEADAEKWMAS